MADPAKSYAMSTFSHLIRFISDDGKEHTGHAMLPKHAKSVYEAGKAQVIAGNPLGEYMLLDSFRKIITFLSPLPPSKTRTVRCLGLNYVDHAKEAGMPIPDKPVLFYKPSTALSGPMDKIPVHAVAQQGEGLDYEGELVIVIGREALNVSPDEAEDYVLGYSVGNDVSHRDWQTKWGGSRFPTLPLTFADKIGQWSLGKCYDGWAPWGPAIVTKEGLPNRSLKGLKLETRVNGKIKQSGSLDDMIFNVGEIVSFLSQGVTLMPGDLIFTGTPAGVQFGKEEPVWLKEGDSIEVAIDGIGSTQNKIVFVKDKK